VACGSWASFHSRPTAARHKMPVSSNVRRHTGEAVDLWITILTSSLASAATAAVVSGWFNLRTKKTEYENAYFKVVLDKRIAAYAAVDELISRASIAHVDEKNRTYHAIFSPQENGIPEFYVLAYKAMAAKFWLSDDIYSAIRELNLIAYPAGDNQQKLLEIAKSRYKEIADTRTQIEKMHSRDMLNLHQVPKFLKKKEFGNSYEELPRRAA
jgi:hypothetical protein